MRWLDQFKLRLRTLFRRDSVESELHRELDFHVQEMIAENLSRGMSAEEARYAALRTVGGIAQIQERCRDQRGLQWMEHTLQDLRYSLRSLRKSPVFTLVAVLSLALGTGAKKPPSEIIGVVHNAHYFDVQDEKQEAIFRPLLQADAGDFGSEESLIIRTKDSPEQVANDLRAVIRRIDPNLPLFDVTTMLAQVQRDLSTNRLMATLSTFFGMLALVLSAIGLYGVLAYGVTKRTPEIGIRMALGADRSSILTLILGETSRVLVIGIASGIGLAWIASRFIKSMLYGRTGHDAAVFAMSALLLAIVALLAAALPARRAVNVDPTVALRYE